MALAMVALARAEGVDPAVSDLLQSVLAGDVGRPVFDPLSTQTDSKPVGTRADTPSS